MNTANNPAKRLPPHSSFAWFDLSKLFSCIELSGKDSLPFLEALSTQTFKPLEASQYSKSAPSSQSAEPLPPSPLLVPALPSAFLDKTAKIRTLFHLYPTSTPHAFILLVPSAYQTTLLNILAEYHFTEDIRYQALTTHEIFARRYNHPKMHDRTEAIPATSRELNRAAPQTILQALIKAPSITLPSLITEHPTALTLPLTIPPTEDHALIILRTPLSHSSHLKDQEELLYLTLTPAEQVFSADEKPSQPPHRSKNRHSLLRSQLKNHHVTIQDEASWHAKRLSEGELLLGQEIFPGDLLLELPDAYSYIADEKGCYPGQEIIARMKSHERETTKKLVGLQFAAPKLPSFAPKDILRNEDRTLGEVRATLIDPEQTTLLVIALLHKDYYTAGTTFSILHQNDVYTTTVITIPIRSSDEENSKELKALNTLYDKGLEAYHRNDHQGARTVFKTILTRHRHHADSLEALAVLEERDGNLEQAIRLNKRLKALTPTAIMPHTNLSRLYMLKGWIDKAEAEQQKATLLSMKQTSREKVREREEQKILAEIEHRRERQLKLFQEALAIDPEDTIALFSLGKLFYERKQYAQAEPYLARALAITSDHAPAYLFHGKTLLQLARRDEAKAIFKKGCAIAQRHGHLAPLKAMEYELSILKS